MHGNIGVGILSFQLAPGVNEMQILPATDFRSDDGSGRPAEVDSWKINADIAKKLIAKLASKKGKSLIDYEHQALRTQENGKEVIAAGWYTQMEWREGSGMWLTQVDLTNKARDHINNKEYLYTSPVFSYDKKSGEIIEIFNVALTNTPAVDGMQEIVALTANNLNKREPTGDPHMEPKEQVVALTNENTGLKTQVATLTAEAKDKDTKIIALNAEVLTLKTANDKFVADAAAAKEEQENKDRDALITASLTNGKLTPGQKSWAETQTLAQLNAYFQNAPTIVDGKLQHENKAQGGEELTAEEIAICSSMQIDPKDFLATKSAK